MSCEDIPSLLDLQNAKKNVDDFGRLMGTGTGTSTNGVTGQVRPTYNAVMANLGYTRVGTFASGVTLLNGRQTLLWDIADGGDGQEYGWSGSFLPSGKVVPPGSTPLTTGGISVGAWMSRFDPELRTQVREALRRSYAEAGYNLVVGSFEVGGTLSSGTDVIIHEASGIAYSWSGPFPKTVTPGTLPSSGGYNDKSGTLLRSAVLSLSSDVDILNGLPKSIPPSTPGITNGNKFFMSWGEAGVRGYIISKMHNQKYVAVALTNEVSPTDAQNTGGASNIRPGKALQCSALKLAKTRANSKTAGVVISSLTAKQIQSVWGYTPVSLQQVVVNVVADFTWKNPNAYVVPYSAGANESITYKVNSGKSAKIIFGVTPGSSNKVLIETSIDGGVTFISYDEINTAGGVAGSVLRREFDVDTGFTNPWYIRITNKTTAQGSSAYVAGLNIIDLPDTGKPDFDSVLLQIVGGVSDDRSYQMVNGANEFAALESTTGKWFGTYHGGHSDLLERLRIDGGVEVDIMAALTNFAYISTSFELYSQSTLTSSGGVQCNYSATTQFGDGCHITTYSIKPSTPVRCVQVFTHMCTSAPSFERVVLPKYLIKNDDGVVTMGNVQHCKQDRSFDATSVRSWWSGVSSSSNINGGLTISFLPNYNKQYYGPIVDIPGDFNGGMFVTAKEYL